MLTEGRNPRTARIDPLSTLDMLRAINEEDATVAGAGRAALESAGATPRDVVVSSAASGQMPFVVGVLEAARALLDSAEGRLRTVIGDLPLQEVRAP